MSKKQRENYRSYRLKLIKDRLIPSRSKKAKQEELKAKYSRHVDAPMHVALVLDGIVEDIIHCDERLGVLLLSNPKAVEIEQGSKVSIDWIYDEKNDRFYKQEDINV